MHLFNEAFKSWNRIAKIGMTTAEIMIASSQTISHRTALLTDSSASSERVSNEIYRMNSEKIQSANQSSSATMQGYHQYTAGLLQAMTQVLVNNSNGLIFDPTPGQPLATHQMSYLNIINQTSIETLKLNSHILDTIENSLKPIHNSVTNNARRLSR